MGKVSTWLMQIFDKKDSEKKKKKKATPEINWLMHQNPKDVLSGNESNLKKSNRKAVTGSVNRKINRTKYPIK